ncbi:MAG: GGDEF domain-containing protein [Terriglobales bacterium]|jgi:diguanylate cyclase (GGDEF)-like protein
MEGLPPKRARRRGLTYVLLTLVVLLGTIPAHRSAWQGTAELHTLFETIATLVGFVTGAMALVRYYTKKSGMFLLLGTGFLGGALLDGYHAMVTSSFFAGHIPSAFSSLTPWSGIMSRVFMSLLMGASVVAWKREMLRSTDCRINETLVYLGVGTWVVVTFLFFALVPVPPPFHPNHMVHRPADFVPALFFLLAAVGYLRKGSWRTDGFEYWLVFSLILYGMSDLGYMSFYTRQFDAQFFDAHALNILGHIAVLTGLLISMFSIFKSEARSATDLLHANRSLATQLDLERRLVCDLEKAEYRATHDFLSGIHNRAAIMELLDREASRCARTRQEMGLLIADIDRFKAVNDTYGHLVGDQVIQQLARKMASALRPYDSVGRFGGEEFLILLPNCALSGAVAVAERLRRSVARDKLVIGQFAIPVTVSIGVSTLNAAAPDVNLALQRADSALYEAKNKGRNRIECSVPSAQATARLL